MDPFEVLFSFESRLNRKRFWLYQIGVGIVTAVPFLMGEGWLTGLLELWAQAALSVKRAHDRGRSGWFVLVLLVPLVQIWPFIELWFLRGTTGDNQYGPDPLLGSIPKSEIAPGREV
jgi:uncharacterized membrane protein YhaH (DUF805 family)